MENKLNKLSDHEVNVLMNSQIEDFYAKYFSLVKNYILNNSGTGEDAKDIFQDVAFAYFKVKSKENVVDIENEKNYILGITRNTWLKKLKQSKKINEVGYDNIEQIEEKVSEEVGSDQSELIDVVLKKLEEISEECKKIIYGAFYLKLSAVELSVQTGYSEKFIKVKKYRCLQGLKKVVTDSSEFRNFQW